MGKLRDALFNDWVNTCFEMGGAGPVGFPAAPRWKRNQGQCPALALALALFAPATPALLGATIIIDEFDAPVGGQTLTKDGVGNVSSLYTSGGPGLLGGSRLMSLTVTADAGSIANASANGSIVDKFVYENGSGVNSVIQLGYNANGVGLAQNWTSLSTLSFLVDESDLNGTLIIEVFTDANYGGLSYAIKTTAIPPITVLDTYFSVPFASFVKTGGFDFSNVGSMRVSIEGPDAYDMVVHSILASNEVPEAFTLVPVAALGVLGVGYGWMRRRQRTAAAVTVVG
jgi:hypothetical protein